MFHSFHEWLNQNHLLIVTQKSASAFKKWSNFIFPRNSRKRQTKPLLFTPANISSWNMRNHGSWERVAKFNGRLGQMWLLLMFEILQMALLMTFRPRLQHTHSIDTVICIIKQLLLLWERIWCSHHLHLLKFWWIMRFFLFLKGNSKE